MSNDAWVALSLYLALCCTIVAFVVGYIMGRTYDIRKKYKDTKNELDKKRRP